MLGFIAEQTEPDLLFRFCTLVVWRESQQQPIGAFRERSQGEDQRKKELFNFCFVLERIERFLRKAVSSHCRWKWAVMWCPIVIHLG